MEQYVIRGGNPLVGEVEIGGAKNAALAILTAATMTDETVLYVLSESFCFLYLCRFVPPCFMICSISFSLTTLASC